MNELPARSNVLPVRPEPKPMLVPVEVVPTELNSRFCTRVGNTVAVVYSSPLTSSRPGTALSAFKTVTVIVAFSPML